MGKHAERDLRKEGSRMRARKCDRCKGYFDLDSKRSEVNVHVFGERPLEIDLCPDCTAQLLRWIKNEAEFFERKETE